MGKRICALVHALLMVADRTGAGEEMIASSLLLFAGFCTGVTHASSTSMVLLAEFADLVSSSESELLLLLSSFALRGKLIVLSLIIILFFEKIIGFICVETTLTCANLSNATENYCGLRIFISCSFCNPSS